MILVYPKKRLTGAVTTKHAQNMLIVKTPQQETTTAGAATTEARTTASGTARTAATGTRATGVARAVTSGAAGAARTICAIKTFKPLRKTLMKFFKK